MANAVILGHSFTKRLSRWCIENDKVNMALDKSRFQVYWHGISGASICNPGHSKSLWAESSVIAELEADIVFLDIGSNDLCCPQTTPEQLSAQILTFAAHLHQRGCSIVIVGEILPRTGAVHFNSKVDLTNELLASQCNPANGSYFWRHSRNNYNKRFLSDYISSDGIHVDPDRGMSRYFSSVRGAVIFAERFL